MDAQSFFDTRIEKAKSFGFPEPLLLNAAKISNKTRIIFSLEIQAVHVPDETRTKTHHYYLKFSKFRKIKEEPFWVEENITTEDGFTISEKESIEKLFNYLKANQQLFNIDILSNDFSSAILSNDSNTLETFKKLVSSDKKEVVYEILRNEYPDLDKKILTYKLVQQRKKSLKEFEVSIQDETKIEQNYWQPFLEANKWMFGLSYLIPVDTERIDLWNEVDYLFKSEDGFIDIVEIKHPHLDFWQKDRNGNYNKYRNFLQPSNELKGAITQATNYIFQLEKKFNDPDWQNNNECNPPVKPTCTVILGRSNEWELDENTAFRLLNDSLHGISIITFDHLLSRARKLLQILEKEGS